MDSALAAIREAPAPSPDELKAISTFSDLPEDGLDWLASHMQVQDFGANQVLLRAGDPAEYMTVILRGEIMGENSSGLLFVAGAGQVTGLLPFSRLATFPNDVKASMPTRIAFLHKDYFDEMLTRLPMLQSRLVNLLSDRIRNFASASGQREKMAALGKLSAGLAHELNNPASAARRAADSLRNCLESIRAAVLKLDRDGLPQDARVYLAQLDQSWANDAGPQTALDSLERSDKEDEVASWLQDRSIEAAWDMAAALVDLGCSVETLDDIAAHVPSKFLNNVLVRMTASFTISRLVDEITNSTGRISELVCAIKEYSYMDQMPEQMIDIHSGIENTLIMLKHRLKHGVEVERKYDRDLPQISARGSELNQIWTNLIVNAADAMENKGKLIIRTSREGRWLKVQITDNGPGIPDEIKNRIFEPFFTTKGVGEGTGLGLDAVYRIAQNHHGDISFESRPGETTFSLRLPLPAGS
jgi:signal transduction histidine kinase